MTTLNQFFDHIYCINLDRRPDRWEASQQEFNRIGIEVERFSATDGANEHSIKQTGLLAGELGVLISNYRVFEHAETKRYDKILILEDDAMFSSTFVEDWEVWSKEIPVDWEMLYLGGNLVGWSPSQVSEHIHKGEHIFGVHALGLKRSAWLDFLHTPNYNQPIDVTYANRSVEFNSYMMVPRMAYQRDDFSDIQNAPSFYHHYRMGQWPEIVGEIK